MLGKCTNIWMSGSIWGKVHLSVEILFYLVLLIMIYGKVYDSGRNSKIRVYNESLSCVMGTPMHYNATPHWLQICLYGTEQKKKKKQITLNSISKQKHLENMSLKITMTDLQCSFFLCSLPILNEISFVCLY